MAREIDQRLARVRALACKGTGFSPYINASESTGFRDCGKLDVYPTSMRGRSSPRPPEICHPELEENNGTLLNCRVFPQPLKARHRRTPATRCLTGTEISRYSIFPVGVAWGFDMDGRFPQRKRHCTPLPGYSSTGKMLYPLCKPSNSYPDHVRHHALHESYHRHLQPAAPP